jgi:hypothetical protein
MAILGKRLAITPRRVGNLQAAGPGDGDAGKGGALTLDNVLKLIPGDVVPLFIAGQGISTEISRDQWAQITFWVCFAICGLLRIAASKPKGAPALSLKGVNWSLVIITLLAFVIWTHAVSDVGPLVPAFHGPVAGFFAMAFGIVAPLFARAD